MDPFEIKIVRQYAINEIAGGLALAQFALKSEDPYIRSRLTYHSMDELRHGWLWTDFLNKKKVGVAKAKGGNDYFDFMTAQEDEIYFLAAVHIYELRIPFHLGAHMDLPEISPDLKELVGKIRDDEKFHLSWVKDYLVKKMETDREKVIEAIKTCEKVEYETYTHFIAHIKKYPGYMQNFANLLEKRLPEFPTPSSYFVNLTPNAS